MYQPARFHPSCTSHGHTREGGAPIVTAIALGWEHYNSGEDLKRDQPTSMNSFGSFRTSFSLHEANKRKAPDATTRRGSNRNIFSKMEFAFRLDLEGLKRETGIEPEKPSL
jgi:hypothetical protein